MSSYFTLHYNVFVESTPVGRLIQRFSKDLDQIDQQLPTSLGQVKMQFEAAWCLLTYSLFIWVKKADHILPIIHSIT